MFTLKYIYNLLDRYNYTKLEFKKREFNTQIKKAYFIKDSKCFIFLKIGNKKPIISYYTDFKIDGLVGKCKKYNLKKDDVITIIEALEVKA